MAPEEAWSNRKVVMSHLHVLDAVFLFACLINRERNGIEQTKLVHTGYSEESRAYCTLHPVMAKILKARDIFFEDKKSNSKGEKSLTETTKLEVSLTPMAQSRQDAAQPRQKQSA